MERSKGRDIYDLYFISKLKPNPVIIRKMFLYYFYRSRKVFNPKTHYLNLTKRYENSAYRDDVSAFVKPTVTFDLKAASKEIIGSYAFLNDFDKQDKDFLLLACMLLGRKIPKEYIEELKEVESPLALLFGGIKISQEACNISTDEIMLFKKNKQKQKSKAKE